MRWPRSVVALGLLVALAGCGRGAGASGDELTVFAAASLGDALERIEAAYQEAEPHVRLVVSTDSSAALATQIELGAPADVLLAADLEHPRALVAAGLSDGAVVPFATNVLSIVVPADNPADLVEPADLAVEGVRIIAAGEQVPITRYAARLASNIGQTTGNPGGFVRAYERNIVSREDNVRAVLAKIELGEGDAAIVYRTDALASDGARIREIPIPSVLNVRAAYGAVVVAAGEREAARRFLDWLVGPEGQAVLAGFGFGPP